MTASRRSQRRRRLLELLEHGGASTQDEIVAKLGAEGYAVTQATVSRDLEELGAVRRRAGNHYVYTLEDRNGPPARWGMRLLAEGIIEAVASGNIVVVRTFPGLAPTIGALLDGADVPGLVGTVAGDDTVLVVAAEKSGGKAVARWISKLGLGEKEAQ